MIGLFLAGNQGLGRAGGMPVTVYTAWSTWSSLWRGLPKARMDLEKSDLSKALQPPPALSLPFYLIQYLCRYLQRLNTSFGEVSMFFVPLRIARKEHLCQMSISDKKYVLDKVEPFESAK